MPSERAPTPPSHPAISVENPSEDRNSERSSDSIATVEIFRSDGSQVSNTPSENTESENVSRHRTPNSEESKRFASNDVPEIDLERKRSSVISKGVILNAMNFGSYDLKCNSNDIKEKPVSLSKEHELSENGAALPPKALEAAASEKVPEDQKEGGIKQMSMKRKIAFGFSFLPSILFVLTFAVILPCEEYKAPGSCAKTRWSLLLNQTDIVYYLSLPQSLLLGYLFTNATGSSAGLVNLNVETGKEVWRLPLKFPPASLECRNVDVNQDSIEDCLTVLQNGDVSAFNMSDGYLFWTHRSDQATNVTVFLSGCPPDKETKRIGIASYSNVENTLGIVVLNETDGSVLASTKEKLDKCISFSMKVWKHNNGEDLLYFCNEFNQQGSIRLIRQELLCSSMKKFVSDRLPIAFPESKSDPLYLPTPEGLFLWTGAEIRFFEFIGNWTEKWNESTTYVPQFRTAKFGNFYRGGEQIALIGQNASFGVVVSVVTSETGEELNTLSISDRNLNQAILLRGNKTSSLLLSVSKVKVTETEKLSDTVVLLSNVSSASDFRTDAPYKVNGKRSIVRELILLQFEGKNTTHVVLEEEIPIACSTEGGCEYQASRIISAFSEEETDSMKLKINTLKSSNDEQGQNGSRFISQLTALDITHQDNPVTGETSCTL